MSRTAGFLLECVFYRLFSPTGNPDEPFIVPLALDRYDDLTPLIPIRIRAANMIRATDQSFDESLAQLERTIRGESAPRIAALEPTDFYCRFHRFMNALVIEVGSGMQTQDGFSVEASWDQPGELGPTRS